MLVQMLRLIGSQGILRGTLTTRANRSRGGETQRREFGRSQRNKYFTSRIQPNNGVSKVHIFNEKAHRTGCN
jgi:hypothetical protein